MKSSPESRRSYQRLSENELNTVLTAMKRYIDQGLLTPATPEERLAAEREEKQYRRRNRRLRRLARCRLWFWNGVSAARRVVVRMWFRRGRTPSRSTELPINVSSNEPGREDVPKATWTSSCKANDKLSKTYPEHPEILILPNRSNRLMCRPPQVGYQPDRSKNIAKDAESGACEPP